MYILALNCGSSSIKSKLYSLDGHVKGSLSISNIGEKDVKITSTWGDGQAEQGDYKDMVPLLITKYTESGIQAQDIKYVVHRIVHGGQHKNPITVTRKHTEGLKEMDKLSEFAPLHNHHAVLAVQSCLDALPDHTSVLVFDTLFHQTIPPETYTYALPPSNSPMPLRKYGFHGLSYASIVRTMAEHLDKDESDINLVVAHLGSGASACCIRAGKSIDTSMGLTPLEGLIGGTRSGTIDPTAIFHHASDAGSDAGLDIHVTKAELILNKESGLKALAGTTNFGDIASGLEDPKLRLAYDVYLDRLLGYISQYLCKLLASVPLKDIGIVFSGGIGERSDRLRSDVLRRFSWLGVELQTAGDANVAGWSRPTKKGAR